MSRTEFNTDSQLADAHHIIHMSNFCFESDDQSGLDILYLLSSQQWIYILYYIYQLS